MWADRHARGQSPGVAAACDLSNPHRQASGSSHVGRRHIGRQRSHLDVAWTVEAPGGNAAFLQAANQRSPLIDRQAWKRAQNHAANIAVESRDTIGRGAARVHCQIRRWCRGRLIGGIDGDDSSARSLHRSEGCHLHVKAPIDPQKLETRVGRLPHCEKRRPLDKTADNRFRQRLTARRLPRAEPSGHEDHVNRGVIQGGVEGHSGRVLRPVAGKGGIADDPDLSALSNVLDKLGLETGYLLGGAWPPAVFDDGNGEGRGPGRARAEDHDHGRCDPAQHGPNRTTEISRCPTHCHPPRFPIIAFENHTRNIAVRSPGRYPTFVVHPTHPPSTQ